jgi:hypothetical protein
MEKHQDKIDKEVARALQSVSDIKKVGLPSNFTDDLMSKWTGEEKPVSSTNNAFTWFGRLAVAALIVMTAINIVSLGSTSVEAEEYDPAASLNWVNY